MEPSHLKSLRPHGTRIVIVAIKSSFPLIQSDLRETAAVAVPGEFDIQDGNNKTTQSSLCPTGTL